MAGTKAAPWRRAAPRWSAVLAALAAVIVGSGLTPAAAVTGQAGGRWALATVPAATTYSLHSVSCERTSCVALAQQCAVRDCGGILADRSFYSDDQGASWTQGELPASVGDASPLACATQLVCIATATKGPEGVHETSAVLITTDGGHAWSVHDRPADDVVATACASATTCFALGTLAGEPLSNTTVSLVTTDDGATWRRYSFPAYRGSVAAAACASATSCLAVGVNTTYTAALVDRSTNGGRTWTAIPLPHGSTGIQSVTCDGEDCAALSSAQVLVSSDGGTTWTLHAQPTLGAFDAASCSTATSCVLVGTASPTSTVPVVVVSSDGGATWSRVSLPVAAGSLDAVACGALRCVAVGGRPDGRRGADRPLALVD